MEKISNSLKCILSCGTFDITIGHDDLVLTSHSSFISFPDFAAALHLAEIHKTIISLGHSCHSRDRSSDIPCHCSETGQFCDSLIDLFRCILSMYLVDVEVEIKAEG